MKKVNNILVGTRSKIATVGTGFLGAVAVASATPTPVDPGAAIEAAATTSSTVFNAFATLTISAFVLAMAIGYARKGKK